MQNVQSLYHCNGHFKNKFDVNFWRFLAKILLHIHIIFFHYKVARYFLILVLWVFDFFRLNFGVYLLIKVGYYHHPVVNDLWDAFGFVEDCHLFLEFNHTFDFIRQYLVLVRELNHKILARVYVIAVEYFAIGTLVNTAFDKEPPGKR